MTGTETTLLVVHPQDKRRSLMWLILPLTWSSIHCANKPQDVHNATYSIMLISG